MTSDQHAPTGIASPDRDHQPLATVAGGLGKSPRWLQSRLTVEGFMAYAHDVPEVRRTIVNQLPLGEATTGKKAG